MHSNKSFYIAARVALVAFIGITLLSGVSAVNRVSGFSLAEYFFQTSDSTMKRVSGVEKNRLRSVDVEVSSESAQPMLITNGGTISSFNTPLTENFDTLATTGTANAWTDNVTIPGAYATATQYRSGDGSDPDGGLYSFGSAGSTDRALGSVGAPGAPQYYAFRFMNSTGSPIGGISVSFVGEQWRAAEAADQILNFEYFVGSRTDANNPSTGWTSFDALDFASPIDTAAGQLDGNAAANRTAVSATLSFPIPVQSGQTFWLRWVDLDSTGSDHGLAIDDLFVMATERVNTYTSSGTFFVPSGVTTITVEGWGGGGGGSGDGNTGTPRGGGGGGGAYSRKVLTVTPNTSYSFTIGAAGTAGNGSGNGSGGGGGDTFFINTTTFIADGGYGGNIGSGGSGGLDIRSVGDVVYSGGRGSSGFSTGLDTGGGGGGGGSAGPLGIGNTAPSGSNLGAAVVTGGGPGGNGGICNGVGNPPSSGPGGGGGGGCDAGPTSANGGVGFAGQLRIRYSTPAPTPTTQVSSITFSDTATTQVTASWTNGNGVGRVVYVNTTNSFTAPATGTSPTANTVYSSSGQQAVYNGSGSSVTVTGLSASTTYYFRVYEYNGAVSTTAYNIATATGNPNSVTTLANPTLSINDIALTEGNSGTTTFAFTVSLSSPAPTDGVTFDIATADGTATADSDYVAQSLTNQTISAGSSTYTFSVTVNGDTTIEANETFIVNVTNVTNATPSSVQGTGTVTNDDFAPTAASVMISGRVTNGKRGVANATVYLTDQEGNTRMARTNPFGYYRFYDVEVGQTLIIDAYHKSYQFNTQVIIVNEEIGDLNITAQNNLEAISKIFFSAASAAI